MNDDQFTISEGRLCEDESLSFRRRASKESTESSSKDAAIKDSMRWFSSSRRESAVAVDGRGAFSGFERYFGHSGNIEGTAEGFSRFLRRIGDGLLSLLLTRVSMEVVSKSD